MFTAALIHAHGIGGPRVTCKATEPCAYRKNGFFDFVSNSLRCFLYYLPCAGSKLLDGLVRSCCCFGVSRNIVHPMVCTLLRLTSIAGDLCLHNYDCMHRCMHIHIYACKRMHVCRYFFMNASLPTCIFACMFA